MKFEPTNRELEIEARKSLPSTKDEKGNVWKIIIGKDKESSVIADNAPMAPRLMEEENYILTFERVYSSESFFRNGWGFWQLKSIQR